MRLLTKNLVVLLVFMEIECQNRADPAFAEMMATASGGSRSLLTADSNSNSDNHSASASMSASSARQFAPYSTYQLSDAYSAAATAAAVATATSTQYDSYAAQNAKIDASGMANLKIKLDLHVLLEKLNSITLIQQSIAALSTKFDQVLNQNPAHGFAEILARLEQQWLARLDEQDKKIESLLAACQQFGKKFTNINQIVAQTQQAVSVMQSTGFGHVPPCNLVPIEEKIAGVGGSMTNLVEMIRRVTSLLDVSKFLKPISGIQNLAEQALVILQKVGQPGYLCPVQSQATKWEQQIIQQLGSVISVVQGLPQTIFKGLETVQKAQTSPLMPVLLKLQQWVQQTVSQVVALQVSMRNSTVEIKKFFVESQKSLMSVKKIVTETTSVVQNSAAAATAAVASASRSLCRRGKKDDLAE